MFWYKIALGVLPLSLWLNVYQSKRFLAAERQLEIIQRQRSQVVDENKKLIAEIAILSSPWRIDTLTSQSTSLAPIEAERVLRIILPEERDNP